MSDKSAIVAQWQNTSVFIVPKLLSLLLADFVIFSPIVSRLLTSTYVWFGISSSLGQRILFSVLWPVVILKLEGH